MSVFHISSGTGFPTRVGRRSRIYPEFISLNSGSVSAIVRRAEPCKSRSKETKNFIRSKGVQGHDAWPDIIEFDGDGSGSGRISGEIFGYQTCLIIRTGDKSERREIYRFAVCSRSELRRIGDIMDF